jgi:hypothetical protein
MVVGLTRHCWDQVEFRGREINLEMLAGLYFLPCNEKGTFIRVKIKRSQGLLFNGEKHNILEQGMSDPLL